MAWSQCPRAPPSRKCPRLLVEPQSHSPVAIVALVFGSPVYRSIRIGIVGHPDLDYVETQVSGV